MTILTKKALIAFGFTFTVAVTTVLGQPYPNGTWSLDENGNGTFQSPGLIGYSNGHLQQDPVSGITTLYYYLGATNLAGDVLLLEGLNGGTNFLDSDLLRFDGTGGVYFFSDSEPNDPTHDLADVPGVYFPNARPGAVFLHEVGPEGNNGALYVPGPGQPGYDVSGLFPGVQYNIISDAPVVPEPSTLGLVLAGAGFLGLNLLRRQRRP